MSHKLIRIELRTEADGLTAQEIAKKINLTPSMPD